MKFNEKRAVKDYDPLKVKSEKPLFVLYAYDMPERAVKVRQAL
jgi:hypothetical protein